MTDDPLLPHDGAQPAAGLPRATVGTPQIRAGTAFEKIAKHLSDQNPRPKGFLEEAEDRLAALADEFTANLGIRAIDIAHDRGGAAVDITDIIAANKAKADDQGIQKQAWELAVGGLTGGAAAATAITLALASEPPPHVAFWWIGAIVLAIVAGILLYRSRPRKRG